MSWMIQLVPFLVLTVSYLSFRYAPLRKQRLILYFCFLAGIIATDTVYISFTNDLFDAIIYQTALFMCYEYFFSFLQKRKKVTKKVLLPLGIILFIMINTEWFSFGLPTMQCLWKTPVVTSYTKGKYTYAVKDLIRIRNFSCKRTFLYKKQYASWPVEKTIKAYTIPRGYERSIFSYTWITKVTTGLQVDLNVDSYILWSLGEGL
jgi:hypothetical protein